MNIFQVDVDNLLLEYYLNAENPATFIFMDASYQTLLIIYEIVKSDPAPQTYLVTPHELILRQTDDWKSIEKNLETLSAEKLITIKQLDKVAISITASGIAKAKSLKNNFVNNNFTLSDSRKENVASKINSQR